MWIRGIFSHERTLHAVDIFNMFNVLWLYSGTRMDVGLVVTAIMTENVMIDISCGSEETRPQFRSTNPTNSTPYSQLGL